MHCPIRCLFKPAIFLVLGLGVSCSSFAHPHSWIDIKTIIQGTSGTVDSMKMQWTFDRMTTAYLLDGEDLSIQHREQTLNTIAKSIINNMHPSHDFTYLQEGDRLLHYQDISDPVLKLQKGKAVLSFTLSLVKPYNFDGKALSLRVFDPTYYVDMSWSSEQDIQFSNSLKSDCTFSLHEPHPSASQVNKAMLIPVDASPDYQLGKIFTQTVNFSCHYENK